jgi:hypothetical protein
LHTHLLDFDALRQATYEADGKPIEGALLETKLRADFSSFLEGRARLVELAAGVLADGKQMALTQLLEMADQQATAQVGGEELP